MWPYTDEEFGWLTQPRASIRPPISPLTPISPELIAYHLAEGRRLRAEAIAAGVRAGVRFAARACRVALGQRSALPDAEVEPEVEAAHRLFTPLTSIRSSSEILRDNPDMPLDQRARFLDVIVQESERLTQAIQQILLGDGPAHRPLPRSAKVSRT